MDDTVYLLTCIPSEKDVVGEETEQSNADLEQSAANSTVAGDEATAVEKRLADQRQSVFEQRRQAVLNAYSDQEKPSSMGLASDGMDGWMMDGWMDGWMVHVQQADRLYWLRMCASFYRSWYRSSR
jgi:hypothetical protein